ncbi:diguanylate cyclase [Rhodanobacter sp. AS-Z3]|uniref:diguanylate cyclase n=1 Tax=Rhodanobacter sp. AS-Z3 TaxID=3031330 RepID=UPI00247B0414|nr:diguanylate cyclase [Rhodanobacter sp. AS-Z3]WEN16716.1 diguanylate cyclase [Rhodanobacter sp. AS-Z3]
MKSPSVASASSSHRPIRPNQRDLLPQRVYRFRMLGMGLAGLPLALVLLEHHAPIGSWLWGIFTALVWPQLAFWRARRSPKPFNAELHNLMFDSAIAGSWVALMHFNALPSVLLITVATADKINTGVRNLWWRSLPGVLLAILVGGLLTGFAFHPATSMSVLLACLPLMLIHTLGVSLASYRLVRRVQQQNQRLDELSRLDVLTGLDNRGSWQERAEALLQQRHTRQHAATLIMVDVDSFKQINDQHGHILGDDVLCSIAAILRHGHGEAACIGRFGGDEFAIALPTNLAEASVVAERIRHTVEQLNLPQAPGLRCSVSLGLAEATDTDSNLREWIESADRALYRAKQAGRNRASSENEVSLAEA